MPPQAGRLWNVATGDFSSPLSEWVCLLPGSNVCGPFHSGALPHRMITEIPISLQETVESDLNVFICHM